MNRAAEPHETHEATNAPPLVDEPLPLELVNTTYVKGGSRGSAVDALRVPRDLDKWLELRSDDFDPALAAALRDAYPADDEHVNKFRDLRQALRALFSARTGGTAPGAAAVELVARAARLSASWDEFHPADPSAVLRRWLEADPHLAALGVVAQEGVHLLTSATAAKLRACSAPGCMLYFIKSHPRREWCTVSCGNRVRVARHSRRAAR
ncbi:ABATE domain-containing protein [Streptomyces kunmingensis]|uniref:ABATE domain-containing protein n=1 Tax=Streptomyces kunmingensis TaxID=68225 RepID=A0ABU6C907_9ACTN|nr:ABATE domain-containing protein [Streptomyces kunmingensis]MEB3961209.1 ABATE domain-containing protein [Streptomyces kunmingensis]